MKSSLFISLTDLQFHAFHGCIAQEQKVGNDYIVNIKIKISDYSKATIQDQLEGTINYAAIYNIIKQEMNIPSKLIENVAHRIVSKLFSTYHNIEFISLTLQKKAPPITGIMGDAAIILEMEK